MNKSKTIRWTDADERELRSMINRKAVFETQARRPVIDVVQRIRGTLGAVHNESQLVDALITHADAIRDALAPFDSGVREGSPSTSG